MGPSERLVLVATGGLAVAALGAFLPWTRIGGRSRSGFATADTFLGLAAGVLPDVVAWVGRWWYIPAFLVLASWATVFARGRLATRVIGVVLSLIALVMWWLFVIVGRDTGLVDMRFVGPSVTTVGVVVIGACCTRRRDSLLTGGPAATGPGTSPHRGSTS